MRAMSRSVSQLAVALALLALFAAPVARAALELGRGAHSCCPERRAPLPASDEPCQQIAPTSCCHEIGVPPGASADQAPPVPVLALAALPDSAPAALGRLPRAVRTEADGPPLPPLLQSGVLLI